MTTLSDFKFKIISFLGLLILTVSLGYCGEKQLYYFGGGGEPEGPTTIFDEHINLLSQFINAKDSTWTASHSFNGGHSQTENQLQAKLQKSKSLGKFDKKNFYQALSDLENKLKNGELKSGDQLLLMMDTHGALNSSYEKTHSVALSAGSADNLKNLDGATLFSMDGFEKIFTLAKEKGVKLAFLDLSCFSGNTLKIANKNVCVISSTGEKQYGYNEARTPNSSSPYHVFNERLLNGMKPGANLEDVFLNARAGSYSPDFPMISTDNGLLLNDLLYKIMDPYLNYNEGEAIDFTQSYDLKNLPLALCKTDDQYSEIKKRIDDITHLASFPPGLFDVSKLKTALEAYRQYQVSYEKALVDNQKVGDEIKKMIQKNYPDKFKYFEQEDGLAIISVDRRQSLKIYKDLLDKETSESQKSFYQGVYDNLLMKDNISKDVFQKLSAEAKANIKKFNDVVDHSTTTKKLAEDVSAEAKKFYDKLYRASIDKKEKNNPCKDFVL